MRTMKITGIAVALMLALVGCSSNSSEETGSALQHQRDRAAASSYERPWSSATELVEFIDQNHDREGFGGMRAVKGEFVEVERGIGMNWVESADADEMVTLPYGSREAVVESVHFTFKVDENLAPHAEANSGLITVGLTFDAGFDFDQIERDYLGLGEVVLFIEQSPVFAYQPGTYGIINDGQLVGVVDKEGSVDFPLVDTAGFAPADLTVDGLTTTH